MMFVVSPTVKCRQKRCVRGRVGVTWSVQAGAPDIRAQARRPDRAPVHRSLFNPAGGGNPLPDSVPRRIYAWKGSIIGVARA